MRAKVALIRSLSAFALGGVLFGLQAEARAAGCQVTDTTDSAAIPNTLRWCVDRVNAGLDKGIEMNPGVYPLTTQLVLSAGVGITGMGVTLEPRPGFTDPSLLRIDASGSMKIYWLTFDSAGVAGPRALTIEGTGDVVLDETTVTGFDVSGDGAGIRVLGGTVSVLDSYVASNAASGRGGAIYVDPALAPTLTVERSELEANLADEGGGLHAEAGATVLLRDATIDDNFAQVRGGGLYGSARLEATELTNNVSAGWGGAWFATGSADLARSVVRQNIAGAGGGGLVASAGALLDVDQSTFEENIAHGEPGGALAVDGTAVVRNSTLAYNHSDNEGGAAFVTGDLELRHVSVGHNSTAGTVHGVFVDSGATVTFHASVLGGEFIRDQCGGTGTFSQVDSLATGTACIAAGLGMLGANNPFGGLLPDPNQGNNLAHAFETDLGALGGVTCFEPIDQFGNPRPFPSADCFAGALEVEL